MDSALKVLGASIVLVLIATYFLSHKSAPAKQGEVETQYTTQAEMKYDRCSEGIRRELGRQDIEIEAQTFVPDAYLVHVGLAQTNPYYQMAATCTFVNDRLDSLSLTKR